MTINTNQLEKVLTATFDDFRLNGEEKHQLRRMASELDEEMVRFLKNRAFDLFRQYLIDSESPQCQRGLQWLEKTIKVLDGSGASQAPACYFSPGEACRRAILDSCAQARNGIDICVFTISDNRISDALVQVHQRGVKVRIITDDDKSHDDGSDINYLAGEGLLVKMDNSPNHMHHKFAIFDNKKLLNGSFNWTRSASERNQENVLVSYHPLAVQQFQLCFDELWSKFPAKIGE